MQAKLRQQLLNLIPEPEYKELLSNLFTAGVTIEENGQGGYKFKRNGSTTIEYWRKEFKAIVSKSSSIKAALKALPSSLQAAEKESDTLKPARNNEACSTNQLDVKKEESSAPFKKEQTKVYTVYTACNENLDYYVDENHYKIYGKFEATGIVIYGDSKLPLLIGVSKDNYLWVEVREMQKRVKTNKGDIIRVKGILRKKFFREIYAEKVEILATGPSQKLSSL